MAESFAVEMQSITKDFPGVRALNKVGIQVRKGEVMGLVGENGAGKSTLMKILSGAYRRDSGSIILDGEESDIASTYDALRNRVHVIYQEPDLVPVLTVKENIFFGNAPARLGFLRLAEMRDRAKAILDDLGFEIDPDQIVEDLSVAQVQIVAMAKALHGAVKVLVLDEPSAVLPDADLLKLFAIMRRLRDEGVGIIYISHRLQEVLEITDRITVLKDGQNVGVIDTTDASEEILTKMMVGRELAAFFPDHETNVGDEILRMENVTTKDIHDVNLSLRKGEILGIYGLVGSGRTELAQALFGLSAIESGTIYLDGEPTNISRPRQAIRLGIGFVTEDRKTEGLILSTPVSVNTTMASYEKVSRFGFIRFVEEQEITEEYINRLRIKTPSILTPAGSLSGGNQQKVVLSKWLCTEARILIVDEPTRGVDVGAKAEIYQLMVNLIERGLSILMISSELPEIIAMCDRVMVMRGGTLVEEVSKKDATEERLCSIALGGSIQDEL